MLRFFAVLRLVRNPDLNFEIRSSQVYLVCQNQTPALHHTPVAEPAGGMDQDLGYECKGVDGAPRDPPCPFEGIVF